MYFAVAEKEQATATVRRITTDAVLNRQAVRSAASAASPRMTLSPRNSPRASMGNNLSVYEAEDKVEPIRTVLPEPDQDLMIQPSGIKNYYASKLLFTSSVQFCIRSKNWI